ncbi:MAG TPA: hypothetical protein DCK99_07890, partial [Blastocatellia bacterium]|nr:hypothetical protein [Blastocatellia bacterium]
TPALGTNLFNNLRTDNCESRTAGVISCVPIVCERSGNIAFGRLTAGGRKAHAYTGCNLNRTTDTNPLTTVGI